MRRIDRGDSPRLALLPAGGQNQTRRGSSVTMNTVECRRRFGAASVGRLATLSAAGSPALIPVTFSASGDQIVFAVDHKPKTTTALRRLANIDADPRVCFLADHYDDDWAALWWVRADARAMTVSGGPQWSAAIDQLVDKYPQYRRRRPAGPVVLAEVTRWTGWSAG